MATTNKTKKLKFSVLKKGDYVKREGRSIELKVIKVGKDARSKKNFVKLFNDVTNYTTTIVDLSEYKKA